MNDAAKNVSEEILAKSSILQNHNSQDSFDSYYVAALIFRNKFFIIGFVALSIIISSVLAFNMPNWYTATLNAVPPQNNGSMIEGAMGAINNTLKHFGLTKLGGSVGSEGYSYLVILNSQSVKDSIIKKYDLAREYDLTKAKLEELRDAFDENLDIVYEPEGNYLISISDLDPTKAAKMANDYITIANSISLDLFHTEASNNRQYLETRLKETETTLRLLADTLQKYSGKNLMFQPEAQATAISQAMSELKSDLMKQEIILELTRKRFGDQDAYTNAQKSLVSELKQKISDAETKPGFAGNFSIKDAAQVGIEYIRLYTEYETFARVKSFLNPMLEEAKLNEFRSIKNLYVVDKAQTPEKKSRPKRSVIIAGAALGSFVFSILLILAFNAYRNFKNRYILLTKSIHRSEI